MEYRSLGNSDLRVSAIGLGTLPFAGAYGPADDEAAMVTIRRALDCGVNFFDTSDNYGRGWVETLLGRALAGRRSQAIVATKGGTTTDAQGQVTNDARADTIVRAAEASLRRLRTDWIDLYQVHLPDPSTPFEETAQALETLVDQGKVRYVGLSNFWEDDLRGWLAVGLAVADQLPYNFLHRDIERGLLSLTQERGIGVIAYQPLLFGLFGGRIGLPESLHDQDHRKTYPGFGSLVQATEGLRARLEALAGEWGLTPAQLALRWAISRPGVTCAIPGAKRLEQVEENARSGERAFTAQELREVDGVLAEHPLAPVRTIPIPVEAVAESPRGRYAVLALGIKVRVPREVGAGDTVNMDIVTGGIVKEGSDGLLGGT